MIRKIFFAYAIVVAISGCTAMDKLAGMGVVSQQTSTFDNSTVIEVSPNSLYDPNSTWGTPLQLGAIWSSAYPDEAGLILSYNSNVSSGNAAYLGLTGIDINVDGKISSYKAQQQTNLSSSSYNSVSKTIYTSSKNTIVIPYKLLESMVSAKNCRIRIHTSQGNQDIDFSAQSIPGGKATAIVSIKEFLAKVERFK
ncbi:TPA: hypothetical protein ACJGPK_004783 [Salmonella enterica subsp. enterica serovar Weltevreden]|uniref:Lipoprotein n=46 Tax=Enterobacterales TaxID=91347 RepID=A0A6X9FXJ2_SALEN|nr:MULTISPECIES: hypothetical protein [Enterobacteriaceae]EAO5894454.1 hypothetical protein [Salmonella enterica]EBH8281218.1 hypothetical protein [Salmonella enterica subsp. enterica serovar Typhimurium str. UK-1]ECT6441264.1 hypothetical protein [Salmonella enterica subsp. enterica]MBJ3415044.1 hypothetical protein [Salmonella enterica subsp. enterica serovar Derby]MBJ3760942.1 hypothetical protein [Salmonella enterica subsp. enterica serovar Corvallis]MBJ4468740.1 hypothetical protein [Sal